MTRLGTNVKDSISGFAGIATARTEYLFGCVRVCIEPKGLLDGKPQEPQWFDEQRLDLDSTAKTGGPQSNPPPYGDPPPNR